MTEKRKLFDELIAGVNAMREQREGKITLRTHEVEDRPPLTVDAQFIRDTRHWVGLSEGVAPSAGLQNRACHFSGTRLLS